MFRPKKVFDRKNGEIRVCRVCGVDFHTMKPLNRCAPCTNAWNKERLKERMELGLIPKIEYKENYPFGTNDGSAVKRFQRIQRELKMCETSEERRAHYQKQLKEAEELGILKWIYDRRDNETKRENKSKRKSKIEKELPDTRYIDWNEYERDGWGLPEDD